MKSVILALITTLGIVLFISIGNADAQISGNNAFSLSGIGFATSQGSISDSSAELTFSVTQSKTKSDYTLHSGILIVGDEDLTISNFFASAINDGKIFRFSSQATNPDGKEFTVKGLGRLVDKTNQESIYILSGTLTDSLKKVTKLVYVGKVSEFVIKPIEKSTKSDVTIKILKGAATPEQITYKNQISGTRFNFLSEDRITIIPGGMLTFVNEDNVPHSLKSGTANYKSHKKTFTEDGKISSGDIMPGKSWSVTFNEPGFFRLFDEKYQWIDATIFVSDSKTKTKKPIN